jgi:hypothetical protein
MTGDRPGNLPPGLAAKVYASFGGDGDEARLGDLCVGLLSEQKETWTDCRQGYESLDKVRVRKLSCTGFSVRLQHNPGRMKSTTAVVDEKAVNGRPCFLCVSNLPDSQKGVLYRGEYLILCNPMPVFPPHFTVCRLDHYPQAVEENIETLLHLAEDLGDGFTVLYNGPRCGASAPDHLHFQVISSGRMPVEKEIESEGRLCTVAVTDGACLSRVENIGREALLIESADPGATARAFRNLTGALRKVLRSDEEPMMSVAGSCLGEKRRLLVFPRAKHRPDAFFRSGDARLVVSPAVIEMGGVIVTPRERDFERLDASRVEGIYREVSLDGVTVENALNAMKYCRPATA